MYILMITFIGWNHVSVMVLSSRDDALLRFGREANNDRVKWAELRYCSDVNRESVLVDFYPRFGKL